MASHAYRCRVNVDSNDQSIICNSPALISWLKTNNCDVNQVIPSLQMASAMVPQLQMLEAAGLDYWVEIEQDMENPYGNFVITPETQPFTDTVATVNYGWPIGTSLPSYETMFGAGVTALESSLGPHFQGYSFEGGFDNGLTWLRTRCDSLGSRLRKISWYGQGITAWNTLPGANPPSLGAMNPFPPNPPYFNYSTHDLGWWLAQCDEVVWEFYCLACAPWIELAAAWAKTNLPNLVQGVNTIMDWNSVDTGVTWWGQYYAQGTEPSFATRQANCSTTFNAMKNILGSLSVVESEPDGSTVAQLEAEATWFMSLGLTTPVSVATQLTVTAPTSVTINVPFSVSGTLKTVSGAAAVPNQTVKLQKKVGTTFTDVTGATAITSAQGTFSISTTESTVVTDTYQVVYAGGTI